GFGLVAPVDVTVTRTSGDPATNNDLGAALRTALETAMTGDLEGVVYSVGGTDATATVTLYGSLESGTIEGSAPGGATLVVTKTSSDAAVTVAFRNAGLVGNSFDMRHSYRDDEALPDGLSLSISALSGGTTNPVLTSLIAAMGDTWY